MALAAQQWSPTSVQVAVLQARGLRAKGKTGTNDAYAVMQVGKDKFQTSVVEKTVAPVWKEEASFDLQPLALQGGGGKSGTLHVHVLHRALVGPDKLLGQAVIDLLQLSEDKTRNKTEWFKLLNKTGKVDKDRGEVLLDIQFTRNNMTASMFDLSGAGKSRSRLGKFKDKVRGKKKEQDSSSGVVPSFSQVLTDSEEEGASGGGEEGGSRDGKPKQHKKMSLFSSKSNLQRNMSQSMSVLPGKNSSLSGSQSSGLNMESSEGKKKFKFKIHKHSSSSDGKDSSSGKQKQDQSNLCINGSHVYCEEPPPRTSRTGSSFSLSSSGRGSMEDVPENSSPSMDSLREVKEYSPWMEEEEEEDKDENTADLGKEEEEKAKLEKDARKEEETIRKQQKEPERLVEKELRLDKEGKVMEEGKGQQRLKEQKMRLEEQERRKLEEEGKKCREEEERAQERRRQEEEEDELAEEKRRQKLEQERMIEQDRVRREQERADDERREVEQEKRQREEEEKAIREKEHARLMAEKRLEEKIEAEEKFRKAEEEKIKMEEDIKRKEHNEKLAKRRELEEQERRREEQDKKQREQEERLRQEEMESLAEQKLRLEEDRRRAEEEKAKKDEVDRIQKEKVRREEEEEQRRKLKDLEKLALEKLRQEAEEEQAKRDEEDRIHKERRKEEKEQKRREQELEKLAMERLKEEERSKAEEEQAKRDKEDRIQKDKLRREQEEEQKRRQERLVLERLRQEEEEKKEAEEKDMIQKEKMKQEEEKARKAMMEEEMRLERKEQERIRDEKQRVEELEKIRLEEEESVRREEKVERERREGGEGRQKTLVKENKIKEKPKSVRTKLKLRVPAEITSTNPFDENFTSPDKANNTSKAKSDDQSVQLEASSVESGAIFKGEKDLIDTRREKRAAPNPPGGNQTERQTQNEEETAIQLMSQINKQIKDRDVKTVSVAPQRSVEIAPMNRSCKDMVNNQSLTEHDSSKEVTTKHGKRPAPSIPCGAEDELQKGVLEMKEDRDVYGLNPFEDDETEITAHDDSTSCVKTDVVRWPPVKSQAGDKDLAKIKSSKIACAPLPPNPTETPPSFISKMQDGSDVSDIVGTTFQNKACNPGEEVRDPVQVQESPKKESKQIRTLAGAKEEGPLAGLRRLQPVKPLNPLKQQSDSSVNVGNDKSNGLDFNGVQQKTNGHPQVGTGRPGQYSQLTREELIALLLKQESQLSDRDKKISELEQYIDNLLVRVMEESPSILISMSSLKKAT